MADTTDNYGFLKPLVGGSENEWGGNLNDNFNELDKLLSGEGYISVDCAFDKFGIETPNEYFTMPQTAEMCG